MIDGYKQKKYPMVTKRYVQWLELESDEDAVREYRRYIPRGYNGRRYATASGRCVFWRYHIYKARQG